MQVTVAVTGTGRHGFALEAAELREPRPDEVVVRLAAVGVCATDLHFSEFVQAPAVLGHEGAGRIEALGSAVRGWSIDDPVALTFAYCDECVRCRTGSPSYCEAFNELNFAGTRQDGSTAVHVDGQPAYAHFLGQSSFASHAVVRASSLVRLPPDTDLAVAAALTCGFMTGAGSVLNVLRPRPGDSVAVFGAGAVGLSAVAAAAASGAGTIVAVDVQQARLELAREFGATHVVDPSREDAGTALRGIAGQGFDFTADTTGLAPVVSTAVEALNSRGVCAVVGIGPHEKLELDWRTLLNGRTVTGVISGSAVPAEFLPRLLEMHATGRFPVDRLITRYSFDDIAKAVDDARNGRSVKAVLEF
jgi:aryl-alcohol dehydrogenase